MESIQYEERTIVFYVSPHRVLEVLRDILDILGNRKSALCRELTKKHEEILRGTLDEIIQNLSARESIKGEMVFVVEGATKQENNENLWLEMSIPNHLDYYIRQGIDQKEAMKLVAKDRGIPKRDVYSACITKNENED